MKTAKKYAPIPIVILCVLLVGVYVVLPISKSRTFQFFGGLIHRVNTDKKVVALTFDDAPSLKTYEILNILKEKNIKATFYEIGKGIEKYPEEAKAIADAGMEIGNHSYSHQRFLMKSPSFVDSEIQKTTTLIRNTGYKGDITFRPPYGKKLFILPWYLSWHNMKTVMCDVEPETYAGTFKEGDEKTEFMIANTLKNTKPGSIILLHPFCDSCTSARAAVGKIIDELQKRGYAFVTVSELLSYEKGIDGS